MAVTPLRSTDAAARWLQSWVRGELRSDSRQVRPGDGFIAWPGHATDGRRYVQAALDAGATTCLVEQAGLSAFGFDDARVASLPNMKAATGEIADAYYGQPSAALDVVAVTGTNGKTSTAWWMAQSLTLLARRCGVVGTLGVGVPAVGGEPAAIEFNGLTTPDPVLLHRALRRFVDQGFAACAMEASSIGLDEQRLAGVRIGVAIFTNFTQDHLDYHGTMEAYAAAKRRLFAWPGLKAAVINVDDDLGQTLANELRSVAGLQLVTTSARGASTATLAASGLRYVDGGLCFTVSERDGAGTAVASVEVNSILIGDYNVANVLGVMGALRALNIGLVEAASVVPRLTPVPGRMQRVDAAGRPTVVVDYAHTPDALDKAMTALKPLARARGGRLMVVFGCGGDRDPGKRPQMGALAAAVADAVVLTSDNPRHEDPVAILADIQRGLPAASAAKVIVDRSEAITWALQASTAQDVVLIAGKGHEDYQDVRGVKHPFSDVQVVQACFAAMPTVLSAGVSA